MKGNNMLKILSFVAVLLTASNAYSQIDTKRRFSSYGTAINGITLDASSSSFAMNFDNPATSGVWGLMTVWVSITDASNSVTAINMTCTGSPNGGTTDYTLQDCSSVTSGVCTSVGASWAKDPSAITSPKRWPWRVEIEGFPEVECSFTDTGGDASDNISVFVTFATKG